MAQFFLAHSYRRAQTASVVLSLLITPALTAQRDSRLPSAATTQPGALTVADICQAAPADRVWDRIQLSPDGNAVAFFQTAQQGPRLLPALSLRTLPNGESRVILAADQIEKLFPAKPTDLQPEHPKSYGPDLSGMLWSPAGNHLLLFNRTTLVLLDVKSSSTMTLVSGKSGIRDAQFSPDSRWLSFVQDHNLWIVPASGGAPRAITRDGNDSLLKGELDWLYPQELGTKSGYWWSPDSSSIAYLEFNLKGVASYTPPFHSDEDEEVETIDYPKPGTPIPSVRVFVAGINSSKAPVAIDTGADRNVYLPRVMWLPDSRRLAVQRLNRLQTQLDLLLADGRTGATRTLLTDTDAYWINLSDILYFLKGAPQFIWSSEKSGYRHLYLYGLDGKLITQLTQGKWEVTALNAVEESDKKVYFTSTQKSSLERQLYVVGLDGSSIKQLSTEPGTHHTAFIADGSKYVDTYSTATRPPIATLFKADGTKVSDLGSTSAPEAHSKTVSPVEFMIFKTHDGIELNAMMIKPPGFSPDHKYPAMVYISGGPGKQAVHDAWDDDISVWHQFLAQQGYIIFAIDNRGSAGRGHLFEEYIHLRFGGQEMSDQHDGIRHITSLPYIDKERIGIWGKGFGGALTVQALFNPPVVYKAGFAEAPVVDWMQYDAAFAERYLGDTEKNLDGYLSSSPLDNARRFDSPMLVIQGTDDLRVHPDQSMQMSHELLEVRKYAEVSLFPGQGHNITDPDACSVLYQRANRFFAANLSPGK